MSLRRSLVIAIIAVAATCMSAAPALAKGPGKKAPSAARAEKARHRGFVVVGTVTSVGDSSVGVQVKGGNQRALKGTHQTIAVPAGASIRHNDADAALSSLVVGDHVMLKGQKDGSTLTASKVRAETPEASTAG